LLNLARPFHLHRAPLAAQQLVASVTELIEPDIARRGAELTVKVDAKMIFEVDGELIQQVLLNLCQNALQAMPNGGQLWIECAPPILLKNDRSFASLCVRDTGTGIAPEHLPHIFDPFFTTKDVGSGTGLGLAVSRRIVEEHGGWINATNCADSGAQFTIHLPLAENAGTPAVMKVKPSHSPKNYEQSAFVNR
jgi:signal transduction histidine kinase